MRKVTKRSMELAKRRAVRAKLEEQILDVEAKLREAGIKTSKHAELRAKLAELRFAHQSIRVRRPNKAS